MANKENPNNQKKVDWKKAWDLTDAGGVDVDSVDVESVADLAHSRRARDSSSDSRTSSAVRSTTYQSQSHYTHIRRHDNFVINTPFTRCSMYEAYMKHT